MKGSPLVGLQQVRTRAMDGNHMTAAIQLADIVEHLFNCVMRLEESVADLDGAADFDRELAQLRGFRDAVELMCKR